MKHQKALLTGLTLFLSTFNSPVFADSYIVIARGLEFNDTLISQIEAAGGQLRHSMKQVGLAVFDADNPGFQTSVASMNNVYAAPLDLSQQMIDPVAGDAVSLQAVEPPFSSDDDAFFDLQWGHVAVQAQDTWAKGYRGAGVRVAVLDSGIDAEHVDIAPNLNLALSSSFVRNEDVNVRDGFFFSHGTHVAGTIGAADNGVGIIGVAPEVELVAVKVVSEYTGRGSFGDIFAGMVYAADIGADIINMSVGGALPRSCGHGPGSRADDCQALIVAGNRVANYVRQQGSLVITAAGNDAINFNSDRDLVHIPGGLPGVVTIAATAPQGWALDPYNANLDIPTYYTNYGSSGVTFAAPGGTVEYAGSEYCEVAGKENICIAFDLVYSATSDGWMWAQGTSMAAPHAAGVAALIVGANGGDMKPAAIVKAMRDGADDLGKPGKDDYFGLGRVNAYNSTP